MDLAIVLDGSGSVGNYNFAMTKRFLFNLMGQFHVSPRGTHFGLIVYSDSPKLYLKFEERQYQHPIPLKWKLLSMDFPDGQTRTDKALTLAAQSLFTPEGGDRSSFPNVLVVITYGNTAHGSRPYHEVLKPLKVRLS